MARGSKRHDERDDSREYPANGDYGDSAYDRSYVAHDIGDSAVDERALAPFDESAALPAPYARRDAAAPVIIPGTGVSMGEPFIKRRERPLTMRLAMITLTVCILVTGLFAVSTLGGSDASGLSSFQALSGSIVLQKSVGYTWYVAQAGDTIENVAAKFHVQIGGIFEINNMFAGQELQLGQKYKIPDDPFYGKTFEPQQQVSVGSSRYGTDWWNSIAGNPPPGAKCAPNNGTPLGYQLVSPNPGSYWVRGFSWYHNGVDLSAPEGNPVEAAQDGQVIFAGWTNTGFGYAIKIDNCHGLSTLYGHNDKLLVKAGDNVTAGETIALEGSTGASTGPHCHFSVFVDNNFVDPSTYFAYGNGYVYNMTHTDTRYITPSTN